MRVIKLDFLIQFVIVEKKPKYKNFANLSGTRSTRKD